MPSSTPAALYLRSSKDRHDVAIDAQRDELRVYDLLEDLYDFHGATAWFQGRFLPAREPLLVRQALPENTAPGRRRARRPHHPAIRRPPSAIEMTAALELASREELQRLSGRSRPSAIRRWLERERIPYLPDADGWPQVLRAALLDPNRTTPQTSEPVVHPV